MCVFNKKHFGALLDPKIAEFLAEYTDMDDVDRAARECGISYSYLKNTRSRNHPLTETTSKGIVRLMEMAVENCGNIALKAKAAKRKIKKILSDEVA